MRAKQQTDTHGDRPVVLIRSPEIMRNFRPMHAEPSALIRQVWLPRQKSARIFICIYVFFFFFFFFVFFFLSVRCKFGWLSFHLASDFEIWTLKNIWINLKGPRAQQFIVYARRHVVQSFFLVCQV